MTEENAKRILAVLREYGVVNAVEIPLENGITMSYIPAGNAQWFSHEPCRGSLLYGCDMQITCWPKHTYYLLYDGTGDSSKQIPTRSRYHLWQQEAYIYHLQTRTALQRAMIEMDKLIPIPRHPGHDVNDIDPYPEDFGADNMANEIAIEAIENWLRSVPNETKEAA